MLASLGFSEKEIAVYLCVLEQRQATSARISKLTSINRPTVYSVAGELVRKGLLTENDTGPVKVFVYPGEDTLGNLVVEQERSITDTKRMLPAAVKALKALPRQAAYSVPRIRTIDGPKLKTFLLDRSPVWAASAAASDNTWWGFQDHTVLERYPEWADHYWEDLREETEIRLFTNEQPIETKEMKKKSYAAKRQIRYWGGEEFTSTHVVVGEYTLMLATRDRPHYAIEIQDATLAENTRRLFRSLWKMVEK